VVGTPVESCGLLKIAEHFGSEVHSEFSFGGGTGPEAIYNLWLILKTIL
jgi:hypothetical protein